VQRQGLYEVREIAEALVAIAKGSTYTAAARRARASYWPTGAKRLRKATTVESGQVVAEWLHQFGPVVSAPWAETEWPECIVLDSTEFLYTNPRTRVEQQLFVVLAAFGYAADGSRRLWRLEAHPSDTANAWCKFLETLPGKPRSVVCDKDNAIIGGVQQRWGKGKNAVPIHQCEHHTRENAMKALRADKLAKFGESLPTLLKDAFHTQEEWETFAAAVNAEPAAAATQRWVKHWNKRMKIQTTRRASLPAHYGNGAIEAPIAVVRQVLGQRKWTFRNEARMNLLLELIRLRINHHDDQTKWAALIRTHITEHGGKAELDRRVCDPVTVDATTKMRYYSLRG